MSDLAQPSGPPNVCRDPDDNAVLAIAEAGRGDAIVTGDDDLLALREHHEIPIVTVAAFHRLEATGASGEPS